jgi:serine/threonine protein kinase
VIGLAGGPTPAPAQGTPLASPPQTSGPGSFTELFGTMPPAGPAPRDVPKSTPPPPPPVPAEFPPASSAAPATSVPPPVPPSPEPGEFTQVFQTAPPGARTNEKVAPPPPPPPDSSESTQLFSLRRGAAGEPESSLYIPDVSLTITQCEEHTHENRSFRLDHFPFRIGRGPESRHFSFDSAISRDHAEISLLNGVFFIEDLGSNNGTFLDGCELLPHKPAPLLFNSRILLGSNTELMFVSNELEELPDLTGTLIGVRYTLGKRLFSNTKSALYAAADGTIPRTVALRILSPKLAQNEEYRQQFQNQAAMAGRLQHSYINRVLDFGEAYLPNQLGKSLYLCMDYLQGGNLQTRLQQNEPISLDRVSDWLDKLSQALDYIHGEDVIHGGIKPSSIVFDSRENPHLGDFAIAANTGRTRRYFLSRPGFMAPEQWEGNVEAASDQYSLAAMMYLVVTGSHPYEGQGHPEKRKRNYLRPPVPAHEKAGHNLRGGVPPAISPVLQRALSLSPKDRFPSAASFAAAFRDAMTQKSPERRTKPVVFLSYRRSASLALALLLKNGLEGQHGCEVFLDLDSQRDAGEFPDHLSSRCQSSDVFVCLLSRTTLQSKWVDAEVEAAYSARKPMVPVSHESYHYPKDLRSCSPHVQALLRSNGLTVLDRRGEYIQEAISKLSDIIRQALAG